MQGAHGGWPRAMLAGLAACLALAGCAPPLEQEARPQERLLVKFDRVQGAGAGGEARARAYRAAGVVPAGEFAIVPEWSLVAVPPGRSVDEAMAELARQPGVVAVEPDQELRITRLPNDSRFAFLYGLHNQGQTGGTPDADIDAPEAWDLATGGEVVVAVIDTGVDYTHPDLRANMWVNPGEIPGNGRDDDGNGFVDDVYGYDFAADDGDPMDGNNHGTHVAGVIAAVGDNNRGVVGVNWRARIMALKFMDASGRGATSAAIRALDYAVRMGARVSNASWGGAGYSQALRDAIAAAGRAGHLFVAAAGNDGADADRNPHYPSGYDLPNIVAVTASDDRDRLARFANFGARSVDLAAPGVRIESTLRGGRYGSMSGTSMAAPFVTGAATLLLSAAPGLSVAQLKAALLDNVDPLANLQGRTVSGGRLNLHAALQAVLGAAPPSTPAPGTPLAVSPTRLDLQVGATARLAASGGRAPYGWQSSDAAVATVSGDGLVQARAAGTATIVLSDAAGARVQVPVVVRPAALANLTVTAPRATLRVGETLQFSVQGGRAPYRWSVSDPAVAAIDDRGRLTGLAEGAVLVGVQDADGNSASSHVVSVLAAPLSLVAPPTALEVGQTVTLQAQGGRPPYRWSVSDPALARIDAQGRLTALAAGEVRVVLEDAAGTQVQSGPIPLRATAPGGSGTLAVRLSNTRVATAQTLRLTVEGGTPPYRWRLDDPDAGALFTFRRDTRVAWFIAGLQAGRRVTVTVTDAAGREAVSAAFEIVPSRF